jgi:hypothetical protein
VQAGAYLQERTENVSYLRFYEQQWSELIELGHMADAPLQDYPDRSVWATWATLSRTDGRQKFMALCCVYGKARESLYKALRACQGTIYTRLRENTMRSSATGSSIHPICIASTEIKFNEAMQSKR